MEYLSLKEYLSISEKVLGRHRLDTSEDNISYIAHFLMLADYRYTPKLGLSREEFRFLYARYARLSLFRKKRRESQNKTDYSLDWVYNNEKSGWGDRLLASIEDNKQQPPDRRLELEELQETIKGFNKLSKLDKTLLIEYLFSGDSVSKIGERLGMGRTVHSRLNTIINRTKYILGAKHV